VSITRREFVAGTAALVVSGAVLVSAVSRFDLGFVRAAAAQAPSSAELMAAGPLPDYALGKDDAPVTIIEYASMTCGHCANFAAKTFPALKTRYIDTGKVRFIMREFPLDQLAAAGFMLARCAGKDDKQKYYALIDTLFEKQKDWLVEKPVPALQAIAKQAGFTQESFNACLSDQKMLDAVEAMRNRGAEKFGVNSTPTFFINGKIIRGAVSIEELEKEIQPLLKS
jgi:protein-disulfide isomerase